MATETHNGPQQIRTRRNRRSPWLSLLEGGPGAVAIPVVGLVLLLIYPILGAPSFIVYQISLIAGLAMTVAGLNLSWGYAGEVQFGQVAIFALGAYLSAALAIRGIVTDLALLMLICGAAAFVLGGAMALPSLRVSGWGLAVLSFFLVVALPDITQILGKYTGGLAGLPGIPIPVIFGQQLGANGLYEVAVVAAAIWIVLYRNLVTSRYGAIFRILGESTVLACSLGFSPRRLKATANALGAVPAGVAGCLYGFITSYISPDSFGLSLSIAIVAAAVLGGTQSVYGAIFGATLIQLLPVTVLSGAQQFETVVYGVFLVCAAILLRDGVAGLGRDAANALARQLGGLRRTQVLARGRRARQHTSLSVASHKPKAASKPVTLAIEGVSKHFGGVKALSAVSLTARPGEVTALIGANGSGKTTLLNVVGGYVRPDDGEVKLDDLCLSGLSPHAVARSGVGRTFQTPSMPRGVSVLDVVASGRYAGAGCGITASAFRLPKYWRVSRDDYVRASETLDRIGLGAVAEAEASAVPLATRRMIEVARAMCGDLTVILLDEPAAGLSESEVKLLGGILRELSEQNLAIVLIEHNFEFVRSISDSVYVLESGTLLAAGTPSEISSDRRVIESYMGSTHAGDDSNQQREATPQP
jgi:branched-chain amino acid transport system permease protein